MAIEDPEAIGALTGLCVVELTHHRTGAQFGQVLADFGADVVCIEPPEGSRLRAAPSYPFLARGKSSVVLDLHRVEDRARVVELATGADVVVETFRPGVLDRLGLGFDDLYRHNPRLVYVSITGFGRQGPMAAVKGYEGLVAAKLGVFASFKKMTKEAHPPYVAVPWCSFAATQTALHGTLSALIERERSGLGQHVEANLAQGFLTLDTWQWFLHLICERWPDAFTPTESFDDGGVPASHFPFMLLVALTKDGHWLQFAQVAPHLFAAFLRSLGLESLLTDPAWKGIPLVADTEQRLELWRRMLEAANQKTLAEWEAVFEADPNVFAELFRAGPEVLEHPQLVHDGAVVVIDDPLRGPVRQPGPLVCMDRTPATLGRPAPALGRRDSPITWSAPAAGPATAHSRGRADGLPLEGITILELAVLFAAPYGATLLVELGARVIKVESLNGDPIRGILPFPEAGGAKVMQGKDSVCVDINTPEGLAIVHQLAARADAVLEGFRAGVATRHHLDAGTLHQLNPDLVYLSAPGYGPGEPNGHRPAFAPSIGAAGGIARANAGHSVPEQAEMSWADILVNSRLLSSAATTTNAQADAFAALGVGTSLLLGLLARARGAGGQHLTGSMLATVSHAMADHVVDFPGNPGPPSPGPDLRGLSARYRIYDAADGWIFLAAPQEGEWSALSNALAPYGDLRGDPSFATKDARRQNDAGLTDALATIFAKRSKDDWERDLLARDIGCVAVTTDPIETLVMSQEFGRSSGYLTDVTHPTFGEHPRPVPAVRFSRSTTQAPPGVLAGEATDAVLGELGFTAKQIADLRDRKIVA
jgi:crotonobetainyl-CoA:carnitine CoA-transferase CaiB-like acyl-CoA transferase